MGMAGFLPDSDCMIAAVSHWHAHHERAVAEINRRLHAGEFLIVAVPARVEAYSVLTQLPAPYRLSPRAASDLLRVGFLDNAASVIALDAESYVHLVERAVTEGVAGGRIYDAVIAACGRAAGADFLLTFNDRDFTPLVGRDMRIVVPRVDET